MRILARGITALRRIVDLALVGLVVVVLLAIAVGRIVPLTGRQSIVIGGSSMEPAIHLGSAIVISPVRAAELGVGDVVSLQVGAGKTLFTHRIVAVVDRADGRWIRTKGDANQGPDPELVPASAVIGRVDLAIPALGYLMALLSIPVGVLFVIGLAATLLAMSWLLESLEPPRVVPVRVAGRPPPARPLAAHDLVTRSSGTTLGWPAPSLVPAEGPALQLVASASRMQLAPVDDLFAIAEAEAEAEAEVRVLKRRRDPASLPRPSARDQILGSPDVGSRRPPGQLLGPNDGRSARRGHPRVAD